MKEESSTNEKELDLFEIFSVLFLKKTRILFFTFLFFIISVIYSLTLPNIYSVEAILKVKNSSQNETSSGSFGGLAALAGVNLNKGSENTALIVVETIKSRDFFKHLSLNKNILPYLFASEEYNPETKSLKLNSDIYDLSSNKWVNKTPTYLEGYKKYIDALEIKEDISSGLIHISYKHISPIFVKDFLNTIIENFNEKMRNDDLNDAKQSLKFLETELSRTSQLEVKTALSALVSKELKTITLANAYKDYYVKAIEPPYEAEIKSEPNRRNIVFLGSFIGLLISIFYILLNHYLFKKIKSL